MNTDQLASLLEQEFTSLKRKVTEPSATAEVMKDRFDALSDSEKCIMLSYIQINSGLDHIDDLEALLMLVLSED